MLENIKARLEKNLKMLENPDDAPEEREGTSLSDLAGVDGYYYSEITCKCRCHFGSRFTHILLCGTCIGKHYTVNPL